MLHLQRDDPRGRSRALMWLRCQDMRPQDRTWIGGAVPRSDDADPLLMLRRLARLMDAVDGVPLVLLVDQLEDMANQSAPIDRFRQVVDAVTAFTDQIPNAVVVLACLEDYLKLNSGQLTKAKQDRLIRDPEPLRLSTNRTPDEVRAMTARRLGHLYDEAGAEIDAVDDLYPFREPHLAPLAGMRARDALDYLRRHQQRCILAGRWLEPEAAVVPAPAARGPAPTDDLTPMWNDFHSTFQATVPDGEEALVRVLADAVRSMNGELPDGVHFGDPQPDGRYLEVETHKPDGGVDRLLAAVCNKKAQGGGLGRQLTDVAKRAGDFPVALVRTTDFPASKGTQVVAQIAALLKRDGRRVVVADADLRRMLAFEAFRMQHGPRPDFGTWQKTARPLGELDSLQKILRLGSLTATPRPRLP